MVVKDLIDLVGLENVSAEHNRVENLSGKYDYIVSRAVAPTKQLLEWTKHLKEKGETEYLFLKGGDLTEELKEIGFKAKTQEIYPYYKDPFFETKKIVWIKA